MDNLSEALQQLLYDFLAFLPDFATALIIFIASIYLAGLIARIIKSALERRKTDSAFVLLLVKIARYTMIGFGTFTALQQVGFNLTAFLTGLGILGFTLGFALQDVSKNFASGLLLLLEQPFDKGDVIKVSDQFGTVSKTDLANNGVVYLRWTNRDHSQWRCVHQFHYQLQPLPQTQNGHDGGSGLWQRSGIGSQGCIRGCRDGARLIQRSPALCYLQGVWRFFYPSQDLFVDKFERDWLFPHPGCTCHRCGCGLPQVRDPNPIPHSDGPFGEIRFTQCATLLRITFLDAEKR